jgi:hypothetical protein
MTPSTTPCSIADTSAAQDAQTVAELAIMLRIHPVTVRLKAIAGEIPGRQIGNRWRSLECASMSSLRKPLRPQFLRNRIDEGPHLFDRRSTVASSGGDIGVPHHVLLLRHCRFSATDPRAMAVPEGMPSDLRQFECRCRRTDVVLEDHVHRARAACDPGQKQPFALHFGTICLEGLNHGSGYAEGHR